MAKRVTPEVEEEKHDAGEDAASLFGTDEHGEEVSPVAEPEPEETEEEDEAETGSGSEFFIYEIGYVVALRSAAINVGTQLTSRDEYITFLQKAAPGKYVVLEVVAEPEAVPPKGVNTVRANPRRKRRSAE